MWAKCELEKKKNLLSYCHSIVFRLCLFRVSDFLENTYFPEMLFSGKENSFKCLVVF